MIGGGLPEGVSMNKIRIQSDGAETKISVDDTDVSHAVALSLDMDSKTAPQLTLVFEAEVDIEVLGIAQILREPTASEVLVVSATWLEQLDPESVRAALDARPVTMRSDPVAAIIKVIADSAREASDG